MREPRRAEEEEKYHSVLGDEAVEVAEEAGEQQRAAEDLPFPDEHPGLLYIEADKTLILALILNIFIDSISS